MRIQTLTLKNFRSHQETVLDLDRFNFVRGPNGSGKSSIQMALEYLFTGRCEMTDAAGRGAESLIRTGEKELEVSATLESGETICRRRTPRSQIVELNGKRVPVDAAETFLKKQFGSARRVVRCAERGPIRRDVGGRAEEALGPGGRRGENRHPERNLRCAAGHQ